MDTLRVAGFLRFRNYAWFNWVLLGFLFFGGGGAGTEPVRENVHQRHRLRCHFIWICMSFFFLLVSNALEWILFFDDKVPNGNENTPLTRGGMLVGWSFRFFFTIWCVVACFFLNFLLFFFKAADESPPPPTSFPTAASPLVTAPELSVG